MYYLLFAIELLYDMLGLIYFSETNQNYFEQNIEEITSDFK